MGHSNNVTMSSGRKERRSGEGNIQIYNDNVPEMLKDINPQSQESQVSSRVNKKKHVL